MDLEGGRDKRLVWRVSTCFSAFGECMMIELLKSRSCWISHQKIFLLELSMMNLKSLISLCWILLAGWISIYNLLFFNSWGIFLSFFVLWFFFFNAPYLLMHSGCSPFVVFFFFFKCLSHAFGKIQIQSMMHFSSWQLWKLLIIMFLSYVFSEEGFFTWCFTFLKQIGFEPGFDILSLILKVVLLLKSCLHGCVV